MNIDAFPFALLMFLGFVAVVPAWMHFTNVRANGLPLEVQFLLGLSLPAVAAIALASWVQGG